MVLCRPVAKNSKNGFLIAILLNVMITSKANKSVVGIGVAKLRKIVNR